MRYFYVVGPVGTDSTFTEKQRILLKEGREREIEAEYPPEARDAAGIAQVAREMKAAAFVLIDLSFERPSCYFELGLARAIGAKTVLVASAGTVLHQGADAEGVRWYTDLESYRDLVAGIIRDAVE